MVMASQMLLKYSRGKIIGLFLLTIIVFGLAINGNRISYTAAINHWGEDPPVEDITLALISKMDANSTVITGGCVEVYYWFYFFIHGVPLSVFYWRGMDIDGHKLFVIEDHHAGCGSDPPMVMLSQYGIDLSLIDLDAIVPVIMMGDVTVYEVQTLR